MLITSAGRSTLIIQRGSERSPERDTETAVKINNKMATHRLSWSEYADHWIKHSNYTVLIPNSTTDVAHPQMGIFWPSPCLLSYIKKCLRNFVASFILKKSLTSILSKLSPFITNQATQPVLIPPLLKLRVKRNKNFWLMQSKPIHIQTKIQRQHRA